VLVKVLIISIEHVVTSDTPVCWGMYVVDLHFKGMIV
jgi:hypothetical protein